MGREFIGKVGEEMKFYDKRIAKILKTGGKITKSMWGSSQWVEISDTGKIRHYIKKDDGICFETYALTFLEIFDHEWEVLK